MIPKLLLSTNWKIAGNFVKDSYEDFSETCPLQKQSKEEIKEELLELESQQERLIDEGTTLQVDWTCSILLLTIKLHNKQIHANQLIVF